MGSQVDFILMRVKKLHKFSLMIKVESL